MTNEERKALVEWLWDQAGFACEKAEQVELTNAADQIEADGQRIAELEAALRLFLKLMDDDDYDFGELCEEFVPVVRAALGETK